jgi:hypothetical protein
MENASTLDPRPYFGAIKIHQEMPFPVVGTASGAGKILNITADYFECLDQGRHTPPRSSIRQKSADPITARVAQFSRAQTCQNPDDENHGP